MQISSLTSPASTALGAGTAASTGPRSETRFADVLSQHNQTQPAPVAKTDAPVQSRSAQRDIAAPSSQPGDAARAARQAGEQRDAAAKADDKRNAARRADAATDGGATASASSTAEAGDEAKPSVTDAAQASDALSPWMAMMQSLADAAPPVAPPAQPAAPESGAAATDPAATGSLPQGDPLMAALSANGADSADATTATSPGQVTADGKDTLPARARETRGAAAATLGPDAAVQAATHAARPENAAAQFSNALAASIAARPDTGSTGTELRARDRDAATTALPADATAGAASLLGAAPTRFHNAPDTASVPVVTIPATVGSPEFAPSLAASLSVLARDGVQEAKINLHPAEMGPITVQIALDGTQARVDFSADMAATRSAIEAGLPELASALRDAGLTLSGGGVHDQSRGQAGSGGQGDGSRRGSSAAADDDIGAAAVARPVAMRRVSVSGLDEYA